MTVVTRRLPSMRPMGSTGAVPGAVAGPYGAAGTGIM
jgi:hypothetical protein